MPPEDEPRTARGVAPVVSVLVAVTLTVILASVVGVWAFGFGDPADAAAVGPQATEGPDLPDLSFSFTYYPTEDALRARFTGGEVVDAGRLDLVVRGTPNADGRYDFTGALDVDRGRFETQERVRLRGETLDTERELELDEATVRVVWTSGDGAHSETLAIWLGPEA
jgi:hypothetical protein